MKRQMAEKNWSTRKYSGSNNQQKIRISEKILRQKISVKNSNRQVSEMDAFGEKMLGSKIDVKILDEKCVKWNQSVKQFLVRKLE